MQRKIEILNQGLISKEILIMSFQGWLAYAKWANSYNLTNRIKEKFK